MRGEAYGPEIAFTNAYRLKLAREKLCAELEGERPPACGFAVGDGRCAKVANCSVRWVRASESIRSRQPGQGPIKTRRLFKEKRLLKNHSIEETKVYPAGTEIEVIERSGKSDWYVVKAVNDGTTFGAKYSMIASDYATLVAEVREA